MNTAVSEYETQVKGEGVMAGSAHRTLAEKIWDAHVVRSADGEPDLLYIDLHLIHEVTSPQAFDGLRAAGRKVRRPDLTIATEDHNVPTTGITGLPGSDRGTPGPVMPVVGTLWSSVAMVRSGRRTLRLAARSPSKACGLVTSWIR